MANTNEPEATTVLKRLLELSDGDLRNVIGVALEYSDKFHGTSGPSGNRLMEQIKLGLAEIESKAQHEDLLRRCRASWDRRSS